MITSKWYAVYTKSRAEKKAYNSLRESGIDAFLPLYKTLRQWSDRKKLVEVPLISSYVFVKITENQSLTVLQTQGVVNFVKFEEVKAAIPEFEINNLKIITEKNLSFEEPTESFEKGEFIEVIKGDFKGLRGVLVQHKGKHKVLIGISSINKNLLLEINVSYLKKISDKNAKVNA